jgi:hypothetical protein
MRCALCLAWNQPERRSCTGCGARLSELDHRELWGVAYLLGQVTRWEEQGRLPKEALAGIRAEYEAKRDALRAELRPPRPAPAAALAPPSRPAPPAPREPRPVSSPPPPAPRPPRPPFSWKNLCTEGNVRWVLNLGIFIFSVALTVFIHSQWKGMSAGAKIALLFGCSAATLAAGHLLRRTILKATGMALVVLGAVAVPIDCFAIVQFGLVRRQWADGVGLGGSLLSLALYLGLARLYGEVLFIHLASAAACGTAGFLLRFAGASWPEVVPWLIPVLLAGVARGSPPVRKSAGLLLVTAMGATAFLLAAGFLTLRDHVLPLEAALAAAVAAVEITGRRRKAPNLRWGTVGFVGAMFSVAAGHFRLSFQECWLPLAILGAGLTAGLRRGGLPYLAGGGVAGALSLLACGADLSKLACALALPAAVHAFFGFRLRGAGHAAVGWLLGGLALAAALNGRSVDRLVQPLAYAGFGVAMTLLARRRHESVFHALAASGAGAGLFLLALFYMDYFKLRPAPWLGASVAVVCAAAFGPIANRLRSRFVSDITYGCLGFAYILSLKGVGVPSRWLGLSVALFGLAYGLLEKRVSRWLLRPSFFTGIACTVAAATFAALQWLAWPGEQPQASLTFLLVGGFYLAAARFTPFRWLAHVGTYVAAVGGLVGLEALRVPSEARAFLLFLPAAWITIVAARREDLHLGLSGGVVAAAALSWVFLDPAMYVRARLPWTVAASAAAAMWAGWFAFSKPAVRGVDVRLASGLLGLGGSVAYILWLKYISTGSIWGGLAIFAMAAALGIAGEALRRRRRTLQAWPLPAVGLAVTAAAVVVAHDKGMAEGIHLAVYALGFLLYTGLARTFGQVAFGWAGAALGAAGLIFWLGFWETPWIGVWTYPLAALALLRANRPLAALGMLAAAACPAHAALMLHDRPAAGLIFAAMAAAGATTRFPAASAYPMLLGGVVSFVHPWWKTSVAFSGFGVYLALAFWKRQPAAIYASLALALLGDYTLAVQLQDQTRLAAFPLAWVLLVMAWDARKRFGSEYGWPLLGASFAAAVLATVFAWGHSTDRILAFFGDALLFGVSAVLFRRPELLYASSASLVALDMALMTRFGLGSAQVAFQLLTLSLGKILFVRMMGERVRVSLQPVFVAALVVAGGVLCFGLYHYETFTSPRDINLAIWGLFLTALIAGLAGRMRRVPAFLYLAGGNLLGAYYLVLHKYRVEALELYTVPIGVGLALWSVLALREKAVRLLVEVLTAGVLFVPSAVLSFLPDKNAHTLAALALAVATLVLGMGLKRRVLLFGGTGAFVAEVAGKALHFLIEQHLSAAEWGMMVGGSLILLAAAFESRKAGFIRGRLEALRLGVHRYLATWD